MMRAQAVLRSLSASFFQRPEDSVMMRARAILKVLVFLATSESRHNARAKTKKVIAYPLGTCYNVHEVAGATMKEANDG